jgi:hypothetical protein
MADLFTYRASTVPMPGLVEVAHHTENRWVHLYCWPCRTTHEFGLKDVERIVYALGAAISLGNPELYPYCLRTALRDADHPEVFAEHVEQGIECRERADG